MEQESAVASLTRLREKGIEVTSFTTDEDSTIHRHRSIRVPSTIRKRKTDYNHVKKSITKKLYKLRNEQKVKQLNPKIIGYFGRCFGYCLKQNKGESFNQLVSTKAPKARHYSSSASLSFRVAASVNQKNESYGYLENVSMRLGITTKGVLQKYVRVRNLKTKTDKQRKQAKSFKRRRAAKRLSSLMRED